MGIVFTTIPEISNRRFKLGRVMTTPGALAVADIVEISAVLRRHSKCDWGDVGQEDWEANEVALVEGTRLFSVYHTHSKEKLWVITEWDRSQTTVLLPSEY